MNVRPAIRADIERCLGLDSSYATDYIWQIDETAERETVGVTLRRVHIPRCLEVAYSCNLALLYADLARRECFLVAEEAGSLLGYLDLTVRPWQEQGWIEHCVVHRPYRRQGIATVLLQTAQHWARQAGLGTLIAAMQTRNDPAVRLFTAANFSFCGFMDHYYSNGDIGLLYSLTTFRGG
jgi:GNAT superfamily N-acetyltransferase